MIDPKATTTYAQYNEDIILLALFSDTKKGFYVDVGANHPEHDSVTKLFYERGWRGINIEPVSNLHKQLQKDRPKDVNLKLGASEKTGTATLREFVKLPGHSTIVESQKKQHDKILAYKDYEIQVKPLKDILASQKTGHIHFLKIDAEGYEYEVITGNDWNRFRPEVVCVEANHKTRDWRPLLTQNGYKLFIKDGLNEYYVAQEAWARTNDFAEKVIKLDYHALKQHQYELWSADSKQLQALTKQVQNQQDQLGGIKNELNRIAALSLVDQPLRERLKRVAKGLTSDWRQFKKQSKK